jgi:hypothetical protein
MEYGIQDGSKPILSILQSCPKQPPKIIMAKIGFLLAAVAVSAVCSTESAVWD